GNRDGHHLADQHAVDGRFTVLVDGDVVPRLFVTKRDAALGQPQVHLRSYPALLPEHVADAELYGLEVHGHRTFTPSRVCVGSAPPLRPPWSPRRRESLALETPRSSPLHTSPWTAPRPGRWR